MPACCGAGNTRAIGGHGGIQALALGVKALQYGQTFGKARNKVGWGNGWGAGLTHECALNLFLCDCRSYCAIVAQTTLLSFALMQHKT